MSPVEPFLFLIPPSGPPVVDFINTKAVESDE